MSLNTSILNFRNSNLLQQNTPLFSGVSLSTPNLNGHADAVWDVIDNNPGLHPARLANMIYDATRLRLDGRQVRYLIDNRLF